MAEAALFSVASKLLSTIASPAFKMAYEKGLSIWEAMDELEKLKTTIETIQAVLLDAEKKQEGSAAVKDWIKRVSDVLYDADDLFDEVATDGMLKQQIKADKLSKKVRVSVLKLNPIVSRNSIAVKVKAIRMSLHDISTDMAEFGFVHCAKEVEIHTNTSTRGGRERGSFVDPNDVIGRDEDKSAILEMLLNESDKAKPNAPVVISIVGIGGIGKTTLAQLIYNDEQVINNFSDRWFAFISDTSDEKEVIGKIFQSICKQNYTDFTVSQLETKIRESIQGKKFLLVLDDVWEVGHSKWQHRMSLLSIGGKGSKIIVTARSSAVATTVDASRVRNLGGLSEADSWDLFKRVAFSPGKEKDQRWIDIGKEIVKKCANVPLAISSVANFLHTKTTLREWESFKDGELSKQSGNPAMNALNLSYEPLPSSLKHCFAYCSLFPKDFEFEVQKLIHLWISQGYIKPNDEKQTVEQVGHSNFMELLRRGFFQEGIEDEYGEIKYCKMHDLVHDFAQIVAGKETAVVPPNQFKRSARHVGVGCETNDSWEILAPLLDTNRVRSVVFTVEKPCSMLSLDQRITNLKCLRALSLPSLGIKNVSSSIEELKHLRYLDLSDNEFESLPDSMTNLLNLLTLSLYDCSALTALPDNFRKLINLRYLNIDGCYEVKHMPPGMGELTSLQYLSHFKVEGIKTSGLDELGGLKQLREPLWIMFDEEIEGWKGDKCWPLPVSLQEIHISEYPGERVPHCANHLSLLPNLTTLHLYECRKVKYLPPLRRLPNLASLHLESMDELEYVEEEDEESHSCTAIQGSINASFFPSLKKLELVCNLKLKGWRREVGATTSSPSASSHPMFLSLSTLHLQSCPELKSIPMCRELCLKNMDVDKVMEQLCNSSAASTSPCPSSASLEKIEINSCNGIKCFSDEALTSLQCCCINGCNDLISLRMESPHLQKVSIDNCNELRIVRVEVAVTSLEIQNCNRLMNLHVAHPDVLEYLLFWECPKVELWEEDYRGLASYCLPNLCTLRLDDWEMVPSRLRHLLK